MHRVMKQNGMGIKLPLGNQYNDSHVKYINNSYYLLSTQHMPDTVLYVLHDTKSFNLHNDKG